MPPKHFERSAYFIGTSEALHDNVIGLNDIFEDMIWIGVVAMRDPLRPGVIEAVEDCRRAGVKVRMVTGDNVTTAKAIAEQCGILEEGGIVLEGPEFRKSSLAELNDNIPKLQILARSSPDDKRRLVEHLKSLGEIVAVTGDGTNDGPALRTADVGFAMGRAGTEVAKEASSIVLMDDDFASIVNAILWGRAVNDAVKKFLQVPVPCFSFPDLVSIDDHCQRRRPGVYFLNR
jgi:Ca2+-transporting ATPase